MLCIIFKTVFFQFASKTKITERMMNGWMCSLKLNDRKLNAELLSWLGIESVSDVVRRGRLRA
jgi:hypothetical protein